MNELSFIIDRVLSSSENCEAIANNLRSALGRCVWTDETVATHAPDLTPITFFGLAIVTFDAIRPCKICSHTIRAFSLWFKPDGNEFFGLNDACSNCHDRYEEKMLANKRALQSIADATRKSGFEAVVKEEYSRLAARREAKRRIESEDTRTSKSKF